MQENRSFDHYFGTLRGVRGFGDPRPVDAAQRASRSGTSRTAAATLLPFHPDRAEPRPAVPRRPAARLDHDARRLERRPLRPVGRRQGHRHDGATSRAPTSRSTTRSPTPSRSATPTTARCSARPTRTATTCGRAGSATTARAAARSSTTPRPATAGRPIPSGWRRAGVSLEDLPGRRHRPGRRRLLGLDRRRRTSATTATTRCCTSTSTRTRAPGTPLYDTARAPAPTSQQTRHGLVRHPAQPTCRRHAAAGVVDRRAGGVHRAPELAGRTTAPGTSSQVLDALTANPDVWSKTVLFITYDENDGFFDHVVPPTPPQSRGARAVDRAATATRSIRRQRELTRRARTASARACR